MSYWILGGIIGGLTLLGVIAIYGVVKTILDFFRKD